MRWLPMALLGLLLAGGALADPPVEGHVVWRAPADSYWERGHGPIQAIAALDDGGLAVSVRETSHQLTLIRLDRDGHERWRWAAPVEEVYRDWAQILALPNGRIALTEGLETLFIIDADGHPLWGGSIKGSVGGWIASWANGDLTSAGAVASANDASASIDRIADGKVLWSWQLKKWPYLSWAVRVAGVPGGDMAAVIIPYDPIGNGHYALDPKGREWIAFFSPDGRLRRTTVALPHGDYVCDLVADHGRLVVLGEFLLRNRLSLVTVDPVRLRRVNIREADPRTLMDGGDVVNHCAWLRLSERYTALALTTTFCARKTRCRDPVTTLVLVRGEAALSGRHRHRIVGEKVTLSADRQRLLAVAGDRVLEYVVGDLPDVGPPVPAAPLNKVH